METWKIFGIFAMICLVLVAAAKVFLMMQSTPTATVPKQQYSWTFQGCWFDRVTDSNYKSDPNDPKRAIPNMAVRAKTFEQCQQFAGDQKADVMAFQEGICRYGNQAQIDYRRYGMSPLCSNKKDGDSLINPVYTLNS